MTFMAEKKSIKVTQISKDFNIKTKDVSDIFKDAGLDKKTGASVETEEYELFLHKITASHQIKNIDDYIDGKIKIFEGALEGVIARQKSGNGGFGYDPIFIADEFPGLTLADISEEEKNAISHRGKALRAMAQWLHENA